MENAKSSQSSGSPEGQERVRCKPVQRRQLLLRTVDVEKLVGESHPVRAIWELAGKMELKAFYAEIGALEGEAGRPAWDPQVLISLWLYAYKDGIGSAREIARRCEYSSGLSVVDGDGGGQLSHAGRFSHCASGSPRWVFR